MAEEAMRNLLTSRQPYRWQFSSTLELVEEDMGEYYKSI